MKYAALALLLLAGVVAAQEETPDHARLLNDLTQANAAEDVLKIQSLLPAITEAAKTSKDAAVVDGLAKELLTSLKVAKGNWGTMTKIVDALGELRSKVSAGHLKKLGTARNADTPEEEEFQGRALLALSMLRDQKYLGTFEDQSKNMKSAIIAKAAYESFKSYGTAKGAVRKKVAEKLMKRLQAEKPAAGGQSGKISAAQQERWTALSPVIVAAMQAVCHEDTIVDVENWVEWWKENKGRSPAWKDEKKADS